MATLPAFFKKFETPEANGAFADRKGAPRAARDHQFQLRDLPHEDVYFFCKRIDNTRLVRESDPRAGGACWSVIGAAGTALAFLTLIVAPNIANTVAGYKLEALRLESTRYAKERRMLDLELAQRLSPERLDKLAQSQHLVEPSANQIVHLENKGDSKVAMVKR